MGWVGRMQGGGHCHGIGVVHRALRFSELSAEKLCFARSVKEVRGEGSRAGGQGMQEHALG